MSRSEQHRLDQYRIIACGPHGFPGAGQIMCNALWLLSSLGMEVIYVGHQLPFAFEHFGLRDVKVCLIPPLHSGAIANGAAVASQDVLSIPLLAEYMAKEAFKEPGSGKKIIYWAHYLLPYALAAVSAFSLSSDLMTPPQVWLTPAGSDIWEIGPQLARITQMVLAHYGVSRIITYTRQFADEIKCKFPTTHSIDVILPPLDLQRFAPPPTTRRADLRQTMGIPVDSFVITSHSNMRPVKRPHDVIAIAAAAATLCDRQVTLILVGPKRGVDTTIEDLTIVETGIVADVTPYLHVSDAELNCSSHDSFNLSLAEALACGVPCVSTDVVGISKEIRACEAGCLFRVGEPINGNHTGVKFLLELAHREAWRREMGCRGSRHIHSILSPAAISRQYRLLL